jgi:hypothetical protein
MPLNPGNDKITFIHQSYNGTPDRYGVNGPVETATLVPGCSLQPLSGKEDITNSAFAMATSNCIAPANATTQAMALGDYIKDSAGTRYRILSSNPYKDWRGRLTHITFTVKYEEG